MKIALNINETGTIDCINILESNEIINEVCLLVGVQKDGSNCEHQIILDVNTGSTNIAHKQCIVSGKESYKNNSTTSTVHTPHVPIAITPKLEVVQDTTHDTHTSSQDVNSKQFLALPVENGSFDAYDISNKQSENYPFELFIDARNPNEASFILETNKLSKLLENKDRNIDSVCHIENPEVIPTLIASIDDGVVNLVSGKWVVTKKINIRYN